jgi:hypothetical protein
VFHSNREGTNCTNGATGYSFFDLRSREITADEVLLWSSSVEKADDYAAYLTGHFEFLFE